MRLGDLDALSAFVGDLRSTLHKEQSTFKAMKQSEFEIKDNMLLNFQYAIDNAPTVAVNCKDCDGYEAGYSAGLKDAERPKADILEQIIAEINSSNRGTCDYYIVDRIEEIINEYQKGGAE